MKLSLLFKVTELANVKKGERVLRILVLQGVEILVIVNAGYSIVLLLYI